MDNMDDDLRAIDERQRKEAEAAAQSIPEQPVEEEPQQTERPSNAIGGKDFTLNPFNPNFYPQDNRKEEDIPKSEGELGRAVVGGAIDLYNSVGSLPKFLDKDFYKPDDPENPYTYRAPWLITKKPIMKTQWGKFVRTGTEMVAGLVGTGKIMWGMKGLKGVAMAAKGSRVGRIGMGAVQGGVYDFISNQSQEQNLARTLVDIKPQWAGWLEPIATTESMSPFQRSVWNIGEGLGIGGLFDVAAETGGWGLRAYSDAAKKQGKKLAIIENPLTKAVEASSKLDYQLKGQAVEMGAKAAYERSLFRQLKNKGKVQVGIKEWRKTNPWKKLDQKNKDELMQLYADKQEIDWGPHRDPTLRSGRQAKANQELAEQQLELDLANGSPRKNPAYYRGGDVTDNQALSSSTNPVKGVRDMIQIRQDPMQRYGTPEGNLTEATIRRLEYNAPGTVTAERNALAKQLVASPAYQKLYGEGMPEAIAEDLAEASGDLIKFLNDSGHSRVMDVPQEDLIKYIKNIDSDRPTVIEGLGTLNKSQLVATDTILGQLLYESRDLAKAALSVSDQIDVAADGSLLDGIMARYSAIARMRKETSMLSSFNLRRFNSGNKLKDSPELANLRGKAADSAAADVATFKQLLQGDVDNDLLESFIHFTATGNGNKQMWKDFQTFFKRKLKGYRGADGYQRNAILNEMQTMGVNSMLSGPKTPARALVGTGLGTVMRPVATIIGATGKNEDVVRGAYANLAGMIDARNDAWKKAVADFQSYSMTDEGWRGFTQSKGDLEWRQMMSYFDQYGTLGEKAGAHFADMLRNINKVPFLNYGPRVMKSMDVYFSQIIARGRLRQLAHDDVWKRLKDSDTIVSDQDIDQLISAAEGSFQNKVFAADGTITDEMALFAADEAKLTQELTGSIKKLDTIFEQQPFLRPFFLFARTGVNALKMTSKYTPILNNFIGEHVDIMTKAWDDPDMIKYGIKSANDLEIAKATMRGRMGIGYGVTSTAALMALNGNITGNGPPDRRLRDTWMQSTGWQPRSFRVGDVYISYESLEPFNMFLSFTADVVDAQKVMGDAWAENQFGKMSYLLSANVTNKSFLAGLLQLQDLFTSGGGDWQRVAANFANNQIPLSGLRNEVGKVLSPGMRELETGFWQSVGNRNLWADVVTPGEMLPFKYDVLNGEKLRDWNPMQRLTNALLPVNLNIGTTPTRELLFRSGIRFKQTFNTGPQGQPLEGHPDLKSRFQFYMGQQNIEGQLEGLSSPEMLESIKKMEQDRMENRPNEPESYRHGQYIRTVFSNAKKVAWTMLLQDKEFGARAQRLQHLHKMDQLGQRFRSSGQFQKDDLLNKQIEALEAKPVK